MKLSRIKLLLLATFLLVTATVAYAQPDGANVTIVSVETKAANAPGQIVADGGNITAANLFSKQKPKAWQGFYGNVSGNLSLEDATGDIMYSWVVANVSGIVLASRNSTITWSTVAGVENCTVDEDLTGKGSEAVSNVFTNASVNFAIGAVNITAACHSYAYVNSAAQAVDFETIIASATDVTSIYTTRIEPATTGFDGSTMDYQFMVPDDKKKAVTTTYYFYIEFYNP